MDVRRRRNHEVDGPTARLSTTPDQSGGKPTPFTRDSGVNRKRIERRLDHAKAL